MRLTFTNTLAALALGCTLWASPAAAQSDKRNCATMEVLERELQQNPDMRLKMQEAEAQTQAYLQERANGRVALVNTTIPVIIHVVFRSSTASDNISDAQINSQMAVLNADFARLNADANKVPSLFTGVAAGSGIQFCLAKTDPNGNPTTGIRRVATTVASFSGNNAIKYTAQGGDDAWDATRYLNIWVGNLGGGLLGYAQFPNTGILATDGVVVLNTAFGNTGTAAAPYGLGRTTTHEVGHWLNLRHIWGDANCGNDFVTDTPTQQTSNGGCPAFPKPSCSNTSDQWMNYMDYTFDACMYMFSAGQIARMEATFASGGGRTSFLSSTACVTGPPPACVTASGLAATAVTSSSAALSWVANSAATSYNVQIRAVGAANFTTTTSAGTSLTITGLALSTNYEWQVQTVCASGTQPYSALATFTTTAVTALTWCANAGGSTADEWIASFALGTISNASTGQNSPGYQDFSALSTNLLPGTRYTATYKTGYRGPKYTVYYRMWIDYNRDGDFLDAGETVFSRTSSSANNLTSSFTVPATATLGRTRLRISIRFGAYLASACTAYGTGFGQVEDYTVILGTGTGRLSNAGFTVALAPNPASSETVVQATLPQGAEAATIRVTDMQGRQVYTASDVKATAGRIEGYAVPLSNLKAGIYILQVEAAGYSKNVRLSVQ